MRTDRILVAGETLVDLFPDGDGDLADVAGFVHRPGGAPANVAACLAALGGPPAFWTRLGSDPFGDFLADALTDHGLPDDLVVRGDAPTALAVVSPTPDGDRSFSFYERDTATLAFDTGTVPDSALAEFDCVHVGGVALANPTGREATLDLARRADEAGCVVSVDPNYRPALWRDPDEATDALGSLLAAADVVCCSAADLAPLGLGELARHDPGAAAADLLAGSPSTVFLTRGSAGATVVSDATDSGERVTHSLPAFDVDVTDTTGAGDAFCAGALSRFEPGLSPAELRETLAFASATGALATTETGGLGAVPDRTAVRRLAETTNA
ncbi:carbohydrate kinase family protein [Halobacterium jilantaiense]|uniref:Fructokinase n=1 Tax=Halobacterium jilantaiense TaxID=355548 RepID=A0A1I0P3U2_9EURY|nr:carbohydrate kinase [Halobacterium jilantaiense]SEW08938.1 fructokinase [Halobacterium jilantaiense]